MPRARNSRAITPAREYYQRLVESLPFPLPPETVVLIDFDHHWSIYYYDEQRGIVMAESCYSEGSLDYRSSYWDLDTLVKDLNHPHFLSREWTVFLP